MGFPDPEGRRTWRGTSLLLRCVPTVGIHAAFQHARLIFDVWFLILGYRQIQCFLIKTKVSILSPIIPPLERWQWVGGGKKHEKTDSFLPLPPPKQGWLVLYYPASCGKENFMEAADLWKSHSDFLKKWLPPRIFFGGIGHKKPKMAEPINPASKGGFSLHKWGIFDTFQAFEFL